MNRKPGRPVTTRTPYSVTKGTAIKKKVILTKEMKEKHPLLYLYCNVGDEL
ncbi:MAG: hypothetical protein WC998_06555 [Candidatus Paceibacterota bacterium]